MTFRLRIFDENSDLTRVFVELAAARRASGAATWGALWRNSIGAFKFAVFTAIVR